MDLVHRHSFTPLCEPVCCMSVSEFRFCLWKRLFSINGDFSYSPSARHPNVAMDECDPSSFLLKFPVRHCFQHDTGLALKTMTSLHPCKLLIKSRISLPFVMFTSGQSRGSCQFVQSSTFALMLLSSYCAHEAGLKAKTNAYANATKLKQKQTKRPQQWSRPTYKLVALFAQVRSKGRSQHFPGSSRLWLWLLWCFLTGAGSFTRHNSATQILHVNLLIATSSCRRLS